MHVASECLQSIIGKGWYTVPRGGSLHHSEAFLRKRYVMDKKTPEEIAKECNVSVQIIYRQLKKFGLKK